MVYTKYYAVLLRIEGENAISTCVAEKNTNWLVFKIDKTLTSIIWFGGQNT